jgi:hypothetical protein
MGGLVRARGALGDLPGCGCPVRRLGVRMRAQAGLLSLRPDRARTLPVDRRARRSALRDPGRRLRAGATRRGRGRDPATADRGRRAEMPPAVSRWTLLHLRVASIRLPDALLRPGNGSVLGSHEAAQGRAQAARWAHRGPFGSLRSPRPAASTARSGDWGPMRVPIEPIVGNTAIWSKPFTTAP